MEKRRSGNATPSARRAPEADAPRGTPLTAQRCPLCHSVRALPIIYGLPGPDLIEAAGEGRVHLGGCVVYRENPQWHCRKCGYEWSEIAGPA